MDDGMKNLKVFGILWGLVYFTVGAVKSFILNANDTWSSVVLLFALFLLPLPITVMALWLPRLAGKALLGCIAVNVVAVVAVVITRHASPFSEIGQFAMFITLYDLPHLFFGVAYLSSERAPRDDGSSGPGQPLDAR